MDESNAASTKSAASSASQNATPRAAMPTLGRVNRLPRFSITLPEVPAFIPEYSANMLAQARATLDDPSKATALEVLRPNIRQILAGDFCDPEAVKLANILNGTLRAYFTNEDNLSPFLVTKKAVGVNSGFIISNPDNSEQKFIKSFLDPKIGAKSSSVELFTYRFLAELGFGAEVDAQTCCSGEIAFLVSHDLRRQGTTICIGEQAIELARASRNDQQFKERVVALEILAKILNLGDVKTNMGNFGIVTDESDVLHPMLLDFHFDPLPIDFPLSATATKISFEQMQERFGPDSSTPNATVGLTRTFKQTGLTQETYINAIERLQLPRVRDAVDRSIAYCDQFCLRITDGKLRSQFDPEALRTYADHVVAHYQRLNKFEEFVRTPINVSDPIIPAEPSEIAMRAQPTITKEHNPFLI